MVKTELTKTEHDALVDRIARWAVRLGIGPMVVFLLECNRPIAPLTGNTCIAIGPLAQPLLPVPLREIGLLLLDPCTSGDVRRRIEVLESREVPA